MLHKPWSMLNGLSLRQLKGLQYCRKLPWFRKSLGSVTGQPCYVTGLKVICHVCKVAALIAATQLKMHFHVIFNVALPQSAQKRCLECVLHHQSVNS